MTSTARLGALTVSATLFAMVGNAHALRPGRHGLIAQDSCRAAGLPGNFCLRIAVEDFSTDAHEWNDLHAHAQIGDGETACVAADRAAMRVWQLGGELRTMLTASTSDEGSVGRGASAFGRALHTLQDDCAHEGMPNPQHAWFSLTDVCTGTSLSPDIQTDAIACAQVETEAVMREVARVVDAADARSRLYTFSCPQPFEQEARHPIPACEDHPLPDTGKACEFLEEASSWDGIDRRWDSAKVVPALRAAFLSGLAGDPAPMEICAGDETRLSPAVSQPIVDVSPGAPSCGQVSALCSGKADAVNPFDDEDATIDTTADAGAGCQIGGGAAWGPLLIVGALLAGRRRRIARGARCSRI